MSLQNIIKSWVTTLVSVILFGITTFKTYVMFEELTMPHVVVIMAMYIIAGGLMFVSDKFFKDTFKKFTNKL